MSLPINIHELIHGSTVEWERPITTDCDRLFFIENIHMYREDYLS